MTTKLPDVQVRLVGEDGNAFSILGRCTRAMKRAGHTDQVATFLDEAKSGDYYHLLNTCMEWFDCDPDDDEPEGW